MSTIKLVQGDNLPEVTLTLTDANTGSAIDLSAATTTVEVKFRAAGTSTVLATLSCSKVSGGGDGVVKFFFPGTTLNVAAGAYEGEITINFNGMIQTVYDVIKFRLREDF
jgi:hypothetical protein